MQWIIRPDGSYVGTRQPRNGQPQSGTGQIRLENGALVVESANFASEVKLQENGTHRMLVGTGWPKSDCKASWVELEEVK